MVANLYDERYRTRRRIEALRPPHAISVEQASYLADEYGARQEQVERPKEVPMWFHHACVWSLVGGMLGVVGICVVRKAMGW